MVVKSADPDLVHRSDTGGVRLNLSDEGQVRSYAVTAAGAALVHPMAQGQVELVAGVVYDPLFGSLVMVGLGGVTPDAALWWLRQP